MPLGRQSATLDAGRQLYPSPSSFQRLSPHEALGSLILSAPAPLTLRYRYDPIHHPVAPSADLHNHIPQSFPDMDSSFNFRTLWVEPDSPPPADIPSFGGPSATETEDQMFNTWLVRAREEEVLLRDDIRRTAHFLTHFPDTMDQESWTRTWLHLTRLTLYLRLVQCVRRALQRGQQTGTINGRNYMRNVLTHARHLMAGVFSPLALRDISADVLNPFSISAPVMIGTDSHRASRTLKLPNYHHNGADLRGTQELLVPLAFQLAQRRLLV
ncbi:hypothetical protein B0H11DRAFT_2248611 [Mycena galericulata]|nr:hypothetical protein B0H11DRAFT_2256165 [Mycena galericulata]KAJ7446845.1 hypothetical protein B0H11DRAFT_2248611 [Mycena galericulata]